jgi:hypothetical protein
LKGLPPYRIVGRRRAAASQPSGAAGHPRSPSPPGPPSRIPGPNSRRALPHFPAEPAFSRRTLAESPRNLLSSRWTLAEIHGVYFRPAGLSLNPADSTFFPQTLAESPRTLLLAARTR